MSTEPRLLQECGTLNRVFAAFFMNECTVKFGVDFEESKPQMPNIVRLNESEWFFNETDKPHGLKEFFHGRINIPKLDMDKFRIIKLPDFFDDDMQGQITDLACYFSQIMKKNKECDLVFSNLPDYPPFIFDCIQDPETNFRSRLVIGKNFADDNYSAIWEFYCLMMAKYREGEPHPIYGKTYKIVDQIEAH